MVTRRSLLAALAASAVIPQMLRADEFIDLDWVDLLPKNDTPIPQAFRGLIDHDQPPLSSQQPDSSGVRSDWNGQIVRLPGFVVPIDQSNQKTVSGSKPLRLIGKNHQTSVLAGRLTNVLN